ncbi:MAG: hypothetical protein ACYCSS_10165 [Sulfuriferula sp.]
MMSKNDKESFLQYFAAIAALQIPFIIAMKISKGIQQGDGDMVLLVAYFVSVLLCAIIFRKRIARMYRAVLSSSLEKKLWAASGICATIGLVMLSPGMAGAVLGMAFVGGCILWFIFAAATSSSGRSYTSSSNIGSGSYASSSLDTSSTDYNPSTGLPMMGGIGSVDVSGNSYGSNHF